MTQRAEPGNSSVDRLNEALQSMDDQLQELRARFDGQRRKVEDEFQKRRQRLEKQFRSTPFFKQVERVRREGDHQFEQTRDQIFESFGIASKQDLDKLHRKVNLLSRRFGDLSRGPDQP